MTYKCGVANRPLCRLYTVTDERTAGAGVAPSGRASQSAHASRVARLGVGRCGVAAPRPGRVGGAVECRSDAVEGDAQGQLGARPRLLELAVALAVFR